MRGGAEFGEALRVDVEGALQGEDSDLGGVFVHLLRVAAYFGALGIGVIEGNLAKRLRRWVSFPAGEKPRMLTLFAVAAFVISGLFALGEVAYKRSFPKVTGAFVALFLVLLVGSVFVH